jgi:hypothetical protein
MYSMNKGKEPMTFTKVLMFFMLTMQSLPVINTFVTDKGSGTDIINNAIHLYVVIYLRLQRRMHILNAQRLTQCLNLCMSFLIN